MDVALVIIGAVVKIAIPLVSAEIAKRGINQDKDATGVESLLAELEHIEAAIKKHRNDPDPLINTWIKAVTCFAYDIEDCVDGFCAKKITNSGLKKRIVELKKDADSIHQRFGRYYISSSGSGAPPAPSHSEIEDGGIVDLRDPIGMVEHLQNLQAAVRGSCDRRLKVISIVGFGGTGKTLLADQVYMDADVRNDFPLGAAVRVVDKTKEEVLDEILRKLLEAKNELDGGATTTSPQPPQIEKSVYGGVAVPSQEARFRECLGTYRYRILLDDVRDKDVGSYIISAFRRPYVEAKGRIILTTTINEAAKECSSSYWDDHVYKLRPLGIEESKQLFVEAAKVFPEISGPAEAESSEFGHKCDGVALALISIAQFGDGNLSKCQDAWTLLFERQNHHKLARMQRVLDHTYNGASSLGLRAMLLYFSMFPAGHPVKRASMVRRCLAEGLLPPTANDGDYAQAERMIQDLIDLNAIWPSINEDTKTCQPPRLLHHYISCKSKTEDFIMQTCNHNAQQIRRLSLYRGDGAEDPTHELRNRDLPHLRTLVVSSNKRSKDAPSFARYEQLRVLDLEAYPGLQQEQFNEICDQLKLLKYLSLRADNISEVPSKISKLHLLETLDMGNKKVILVPIEIIELPRLKHLIGKFELLDGLGRKAKELMGSFKKIEGSKLERFSGFVTRKGQGFPSLMCHMTRLKKVKIWFYPDADANRLTSHLPDAITKFLSNESTNTDNDDDAASRRSLSLDFQESKTPGELLDYLAKASGKLYSLKLSGRYQVIREISSFAARMEGITKLCLSWTQETLSWNNDILKHVSTLTELEYLKIQVKEIEGVHPQEAGPSGATVLPVKTGQFDKMKRMCLQTEKCLPHLKAHDGALNNLASLHLICGTLDCPSAQQIAQLKGLKEVALLSGLGNDTKKAWREAARSHRNVPYVLFIQVPRSA